MYKIRIKRRFLGWRTVRVKSHYLEAAITEYGDNDQRFLVPIRPWLCLQRADGVFEVIPNIDSRRWIVYPKAEEPIALRSPNAAILPV